MASECVPMIDRKNDLHKQRHRAPKRYVSICSWAERAAAAVLRVSRPTELTEES